MSSRRREQILENCRWLFNQEVQLITFVVRKHFTTIFNKSGSNSPYEQHYYAAVLPKECSLRSADIGENVLIMECHLLSTDGATSMLLEKIEQRIGGMLEVEVGRIRIIEPLGVSGDEAVETLVLPTTSSEPLKCSLGAVVVNRLRTQPLEGWESVPPSRTMEPETEAPLVAHAVSATHTDLAEKRLSSLEILAPIADHWSKLTKSNLSAFNNKKERKRFGETPYTAARRNVLTSSPPVPCPQEQVPNPVQKSDRTSLIFPQLSLNGDAEDPPKQEATSPPLSTSPDTLLVLTQKMAEMEIKLRALESSVQTIQSRQRYSEEPSTPSDVSSAHTFSPILTPATSVASNAIMSPVQPVPRKYRPAERKRLKRLEAAHGIS